MAGAHKTYEGGLKSSRNGRVKQERGDFLAGTIPAFNIDVNTTFLYFFSYDNHINYRYFEKK